MSYLPARRNDIIRKRIEQIFKENNLKITADVNKEIVNFLDITFNVKNMMYKPYTKENSSIKYVNVQSNHPEIIIKNIPEGSNTRFTQISSSSELVGWIPLKHHANFTK